jgi:hypothetical protein
MEVSCSAAWAREAPKSFTEMGVIPRRYFVCDQGLGLFIHEQFCKKSFIQKPKVLTDGGLKRNGRLILDARGVWDFKAIRARGRQLQEQREAQRQQQVSGADDRKGMLRLYRVFFSK